MQECEENFLYYFYLYYYYVVSLSMSRRVGVLEF